MRSFAPACVLIAALSLSAGCGGGASTKAATAPPPGSIAALLARPGADVAFAPGTAHYVPGSIRIAFIVIRNDGSVVKRPAARVWIADGFHSKPYQEVRAGLEPIGVPGKSEHAVGGVSRIYVAHVRTPRPGKYWVLAEPIGGRPIQALGNAIVTSKSSEPGIGEKAIPSRTPTIASTGGNFRRLTTASPPDRELLRDSVAGSLAAHKPFVLVFATPNFCTSRTCGPVVDVVDAVRRRFTGTPVRFIHVEVYRDNDPAKGYNRFMREWRLPSEPWTFLVGADGRIKGKYEGSVSVAELAAAVRTQLI